MNIVLANVDYQQHTSNEGDQFQEGLRKAGWRLFGKGYRDSEQSVPAILNKHRPRRVIVHDKRDWDPCSGICFRNDMAFTNLNALSEHGRGDVYLVVKDAATFQRYQELAAAEVAPDALIVYYHPDIIVQHSPWMGRYKMIRTYHSVDADFISGLSMSAGRNNCVVTGAVSGAYPLRALAIQRREDIGAVYAKHPGYGNRGSRTGDYLRMLSRYKTHIATASKFGFALRKIIESVAVGCTPITDLPATDRLPEIDDALVRVPPGCKFSELRGAVLSAEQDWNLDERLEYARRAREWYDWKAVGRRLSDRLMERGAENVSVGAA